jgi:hypothetical protein
VERDTIIPQADDRGSALLEEVFIKGLLIFSTVEHSSKNRENDKCGYIMYSSSVGNNDIQAYNKKGLT